MQYIYTIDLDDILIYHIKYFEEYKLQNDFIIDFFL